ncbi:hypothetical protein JOB18_034130 [Solea senegalensis]|uniref:Helix-turn-helix domain-containing protein n=1 Tax=Solea senegalensis TaxID=28829 RepID=A0AAV6SS33_SOLSE|nr:hypothetical protein JOB18_034130 [Solea senegalensis]
MDRVQYLWEGYRQLNDKNYYVKLQKPIYLDTIPLVTKIINKLHEKKFINSKQKQYLLGDPEPRPRRFYMLPKIHKDPVKWSKPHIMPPGRPIVSDCSSETYRIAEYLDFFLNPLSTTHPSYIKDTYDFIDKIKNVDIPADSFLFTIDIDSLYTNIDIKEGIQSGTAMGKKFAPTYANIFMADWEAGALRQCEKRPIYYYRYLDDIWGVWTYSEDDFKIFLNTLNNYNPSIKVKSTMDRNSVDFLNTTTFKGPTFNQTNRLDVKVFFKETDTHALLHKTSFHPKHTFAGLIKSQLLRFHRICTQKEDFQKATKVLFTALASRGYSRSFLRNCYKRFLQIKPQIVSSVVPFITTYSDSMVKLVREIKKNFENSFKERGILYNHRIIAAFRKNKNLKDYLVKAKIPD